jgi:hypothetical protein
VSRACRGGGRSAAPSAACILTLAAAFAGSSCALRRPPQANRGIPVCASAASADLLSVDALQCWFESPHGRWRVLSHESHYDVLVVQVAASDVRDADLIASRFVDNQRRFWSEILLYVRPDAARGRATIQRIRWTPDGGFERLELSQSR